MTRQAWRRVVTEVRAIALTTSRLLAGKDLAAAAATLTYYAGIAVVPWLLFAVWTTAWPRGGDAAEEWLHGLRVLVPPDMGARPSYDALVHAGTHLEPITAVVLLFPASFWGEGVRRATLQLSPESDRFTGWRARVSVLAPVVVLPLLAAAFFGVGHLLAPLAPDGGGGGAGALVVRVVVGFLLLWLLLSVLLTWAFRVVAVGQPRWWVAAVGALATGSCLAGFLHGFQLFLSIPLDVGLPFAGLGVVGGVVAVGFWLYVLHVNLLLGWAVTRALDLRVDELTGRPA